MKELKQLIKDLSAEQTTLKSQRKTGTLPEFKRDYFGYPLWSEVPTEQRVRIKNAWSAANRVQSNKARITAALNLYHELRGSDYRHNVSDEHSWAYGRALKELREEFAVEPAE